MEGHTLLDKNYKFHTLLRSERENEYKEQYNKLNNTGQHNQMAIYLLSYFTPVVCLQHNCVSSL